MQKATTLLLFAVVSASAGSSHAGEKAQRVRIMTQARGASSDVKDAASGIAELRAALAVGEVEVAGNRADVANAKGPLEKALATARLREAEDRVRTAALERVQVLSGDVDHARVRLATRLKTIVAPGGRKPDARIARDLMAPEGAVVVALINGDRKLAALQGKLAAVEVATLAHDLAGAIASLEEGSNALEGRMGESSIIDLDSEPSSGEPTLMRMIGERAGR